MSSPSYSKEEKQHFSRAQPSLLLPAVVSSDLKGRGLSLNSVRIWLFADMIQLIPGGGPERLSWGFFSFLHMCDSNEDFFFPTKFFSIPSVTNVKALLCPDPFFYKEKKRNLTLF